MTNLLLSILMLILAFGLSILFYRIKGKSGLLFYIGLATATANLLAVKLTSVFGIPFYMGNALYASTFLATDILNEKYGKKAAKEAVFYGVAGMIILPLFLWLATLFIPAGEDTMQESFQKLTQFELRISAGSLISYALSQWISVSVFHRFHEKDGAKKLWLRNNVSTLTAELFDTALFVFIAYFGTVSLKTLLSVFLIMYGLKALSALIDTPFLYIARKL